ncbi:MAG TPA: hypothetical protein VFL38_07860 [Humibacillus xanthopallidus]|nr:hypothetical protein [Humibacillus xanthopallidus]
MSSRPATAPVGLLRQTDGQARGSDPLARLLRLSFDVAALSPLVRRDAQQKVDLIVRELDEVIQDLRLRSLDSTAPCSSEHPSRASARMSEPVVTRLPSGPDYPALP